MKNTLSSSPLLTGTVSQFNKWTKTTDERAKIDRGEETEISIAPTLWNGGDATTILLFISDEYSIIRGRIYHININRVRHIVR